jgi:hypothetical protein
VAPDYRSDRMESPEGRGNAKKAWEAYVRAYNKHAAATLEPVLKPVLRPIAMNMAADLFGFWLIWHLEGGFDGLRRLGFSRSGIYRRVKRFRQITGQHPDEFVMPGVSFDLAAYQNQKADDPSVVPGLETT